MEVPTISETLYVWPAMVLLINVIRIFGKEIRPAGRAVHAD
ncbi:hypothetical protein ANMWB30_02410 [Arthrobacter sp. MWB30]|nr:hypothetical protein ANMWB30_02410 [Arthrobacter sp. MWB30]